MCSIFLFFYFFNNNIILSKGSLQVLLTFIGLILYYYIYKIYIEVGLFLTKVLC